MVLLILAIMPLVASAGRHHPKVFRVFHTDKLTPAVRELHQKSAIASEIPLEHHQLVVDGSAFANASLVKCNALDLFHAILPGAFKADLLRYCLLYLHGGVYLDLMTRLTHPAKHLFEYDLAVVKDRHPRMYWNGFIAGKKGHPAFKLAIDLIRFNVKHCRRTWSDLAVTGPVLWYQAAHKFKRTVLGKITNNCEHLFKRCGEVSGLFINKMPNYTAEFAKMGSVPKLKYGAMWKRGEVYDPRLCKLADFSFLFWL